MPRSSRRAEPHGEALTLPPRQVLSGFYLNELIINLTTRHDPQPQLFEDYAQALRRLCGGRRAGAGVARVREAAAGSPSATASSSSSSRRATTSSAPAQGLAEVREDAPGAYSGRCLLALQQET